MKFGETFTEYLLGEDSFDLNKYSHVDYKRLKKLLKICRHHHHHHCHNSSVIDESDRNTNVSSLPYDHSSSCQWCDKMFFSEIMKEATDIAGCLSSRVRQDILSSFIALLGRMLIEYVIMNAIALRKILKKYDKVHNSVSGMNFKSKLRAEHLEISQSPWLIELVAFYMNFSESNPMSCNELCVPFSCDLIVTDSEPVLKLVLPDYANLEYNLTCAICLSTVFHPYALSCGHIFCKSCACSAGSVLIFEEIKSVSPKIKCPVCREEGVYGDAVCMTELDLLLKRRFKEQWKTRLVEERTEIAKQTKEHWELQTRYITGL